MIVTQMGVKRTHKRKLNAKSKLKNEDIAKTSATAKSHESCQRVMYNFGKPLRSETKKRQRTAKLRPNTQKAAVIEIKRDEKTK